MQIFLKNYLNENEVFFFFFFCKGLKSYRYLNATLYLENVYMYVI
jgi:hypothetical protein